MRELHSYGWYGAEATNHSFVLSKRGTSRHPHGLCVVGFSFLASRLLVLARADWIQMQRSNAVEHPLWVHEE